MYFYVLSMCPKSLPKNSVITTLQFKIESGLRVYVAGRITYSVYEDDHGAMKEASSIVADDVIPFT